jgi:hypothetical protein
MATKALTQMAGAALGCFVVVSLLTAGRSPLAVLFGLLGPLAAAVASWVLIERAYHQSQARASALMVKLFGAKMVFFGAYVAAVVLWLLPEARVPFVVSFVSHYILLHLMEALCLRRLFAARDRRMVDGQRLSVS